MGEFKTIGNVKQFIEATTQHQQGLVRDTYAFRSAIPDFLRPFVQDIGPWPGDKDVAWDAAQPTLGGRAVATLEKAHLGSFDTYQIVAKPSIQIGGHTYRTTPDDFIYPMAAQIAALKAEQPILEWNRAMAEAILDIALSGAFSSSTNDFTEAKAFTVKNFRGTDVAVSKPTESATVASATVAHASHLTTWPDRKGGTFAAGHDHVIAAAGASWTAALGRTARNHITEHPGQNKVLAIVGKNVDEDVRGVVTTTRANTESGVGFAQLGLANSDFGSAPQFIATHENVDYYFQPDMPDDIAMYVAAGKKPIGVSIGRMRTDGQTDSPFPWNTLGQEDRETRAVEYGFRGFGSAYIVDPVALYLVEYT